MKRRWKIRNPQFRAFLYLLPALSVIAVFQFYPVLKSFFMGFYTKFDYLTDTVEAVGLDNFLYVLKDPEFALAMKNTAVFAVISVPLGIIMALVFALILNSISGFRNFSEVHIFFHLSHRRPQWLLCGGGCSTKTMEWSMHFSQCLGCQK